MEARKCKCCVCGKQAYAFWPVIDPDIPSNAYCKKCLREQQMKVIVGVLGKEEGKRMFKLYQKPKQSNY